MFAKHRMSYLSNVLKHAGNNFSINNQNKHTTLLPSDSINYENTLKFNATLYKHFHGTPIVKYYEKK